MKRQIPTRVGTNPPATSHQRLGNLLWHDSLLGLHDAGCYPSCDSGNWADLHICDELTSYPIFGLNRSPIWHFDWRVWLWAKEANSTTWRREGKCCQWVGIQHAKQFTFICDPLSPFVQKKRDLGFNLDKIWHNLNKHLSHAMLDTHLILATSCHSHPLKNSVIHSKNGVIAVAWFI